MGYSRKRFLATAVDDIMESFAEIGFEIKEGATDNPAKLYFTESHNDNFWIEVGTTTSSGTDYVNTIKACRLNAGSRTEEKTVIGSSVSTYIEFYICELAAGIAFGVYGSAAVSQQFDYPYIQFVIAYDSAIEDYVFIRKYDLTGAGFVTFGDTYITGTFFGGSDQAMLSTNYFSLVKFSPIGAGVVFNDIYVTAYQHGSSSGNVDDKPIEVVIGGKHYIIFGSSIGYGHNRRRLAMELKSET